MRKRTVFLSMAVAAAAAFGVIAPMASASEPAAEAASWRCDDNYDGGLVTIDCFYRGTWRAYANVSASAEPETTTASDRKTDGKSVIAYVRRTSDGKLLRRVENAGGSTQKTVSMREGTHFTLQLCLSGGLCSDRFPGKA